MFKVVLWAGLASLFTISPQDLLVEDVGLLRASLNSLVI